ncbi:MAG: polysaccharide pyruvyl transferase family protein [Actinomycetota bacterium]|nr:polysaccharide pyruvyl transferase family protein [Actinomycetota bacterium]
MRVLVAAWVGSTNLGDELVFAAVAARLRRRGVDVEVVSVDPDATRRDHPGVDVVPARDLRAVDSAVARADRVVFGGGGLLQDKTSVLNLPYHLSRLALARWRRTPYVGLGLGVGPLETALGRHLARAAMTRARAVSVRDADSAALLASTGISGIRVTADPALGLPVPTVAPQDRLVVSLRAWSPSRGVLPASLRARQVTSEAWLRTSAGTLDQASRATGLAVHLVALQPDRDGSLHDAVADRMTAAVTTARPGLHQVVDEVATGRLVVAMRYHAGVAAVLAARPTVLLGYSLKVDSLATELGPGAAHRAWEPEGVRGLTDALAEVTGRDADMREARDRLRDREHGNDAVLEALAY